MSDAKTDWLVTVLDAITATSSVLDLERRKLPLHEQARALEIAAAAQLAYALAFIEQRVDEIADRERSIILAGKLKKTFQLSTTQKEEKPLIIIPS